ncbi:hypothetical protein KMT30_07825 [Streptomyces sp. IBSBF 2953]|nr:hypothetical protein [Streptomyces hayashii]
MTDQTEPIRKSLLPCTPPPEWEFTTVWGPRTGEDGVALFPGDRGPVVVRRLVSYGDWEPVRPDRWADEPPTDAASAVSLPLATDQTRCVCGAPIEWMDVDVANGSGWIHSPGSDTPCLDARPAPATGQTEPHSCRNCEGIDPDTCLANPELTLQEARDLADKTSLDLYRAQDALAFVAECCDIADREQQPITTALVREWLKGDRCTRQRAADRAAAAAVVAVLPADQRAATLREAADAVAADTGFHIRYGAAVDYANHYAALLRRMADHHEKARLASEWPQTLPVLDPKEAQQ